MHCGPGCKGGRCVRLTTLPLYVPSVKKFWAPIPPVTLRASLQWDSFLPFDSCQFSRRTQLSGVRYFRKCSYVFSKY